MRSRLTHRRQRRRCRPELRCGRALLCTLVLLLSAVSAVAQQQSLWIRPQKPGDPLLWGRKDGLVFALPPDGGLRGPRGLVRLGFFAPGATTPDLLNFLAIEPVVVGPGRRFDRMSFSELEMSDLDAGVRGKRLSVHVDPRSKEFAAAGTLSTNQMGRNVVERLSVPIDVESFSVNGAHVSLVLSMDSDHPYELRVSVFAAEDSPPLEELSVTATMGNFERLRQLWLRDRVVDSRVLFENYTGDAFVEQATYPLGDMLRSSDGDALVFCTPSEVSPKDTPGNATAHWQYPLPRMNQYWRVPGHDIEPDLRVRVNARRVYWASTAPVLGGIAFENFEVRERYVPGQTFIYGITPDEPMTFLHDLVQGEMPARTHPQSAAEAHP